MSLKYPNRILSTLAILPLSILTSNVEIEGSCKEFSFGIQELLAGTQENSGENAEFIIEGNKRILQVRGTVWCDGDSKNKVLNINKNKIPNWQKKLAET